MKALCVTSNGGVELRDVPTPIHPPADHLLVDIEACGINHGDIFFLKAPQPTAVTTGPGAVWGVSAVGRVVATGAGVPAAYAGKRVAIYRSLRKTPETIGLWCERAQVHYLSCLILPDEARAKDLCGSLVNVITAYAFLRQAEVEGHAGIVATAGHSATANALIALAGDKPVLHLVRSASARDELRRIGAEHVLVTGETDFEGEFAALAARLDATAVFDGLGGDIVGRLAPRLPVGSTFYFYGFLGGAVPMSLATSLFMMKNLTMKRFSNFESLTVKDDSRLAAALADLSGRIDDPRFHTRIGKEFRFEEIEAALAHHGPSGAKAVLVV